MDGPTEADAGQLEMSRSGPGSRHQNRRDELERRRALVEGMMRIGMSVRDMVEALSKAEPPIFTSKSRVGDDRIIIRKRWIASYTEDYGDHVAEVWSVFTKLLELAMEQAQLGSVAAIGEARKINAQMGRMVGAFLPDQLQIVGAGGGPVQVEHTLSIEARIARGRAIAERFLGEPEAIEAASTEHVNNNGSSSNGHAA